MKLKKTAEKSCIFCHDNGLCNVIKKKCKEYVNCEFKLKIRRGWEYLFA